MPGQTTGAIIRLETARSYRVEPIGHVSIDDGYFVIEESVPDPAGQILCEADTDQEAERVADAFRALRPLIQAAEFAESWVQAELLEAATSGRPGDTYACEQALSKIRLALKAGRKVLL